MGYYNSFVVRIWSDEQGLSRGNIEHVSSHVLSVTLDPDRAVVTDTNTHNNHGQKAFTVNYRDALGEFTRQMQFPVDAEANADSAKGLLKPTGSPTRSICALGWSWPFRRAKSEMATMAGTPQLSHIALRIEGAVASEEVAANLLQVVVDHSLHLPGMFTIRLLNHDIKWLQDETFREGKKIEIFCGERSKFKLLSGKIASLEPDLDVAHPTLLVRGYDPSHKLYRGHAP